MTRPLRAHVKLNVYYHPAREPIWEWVIAHGDVAIDLGSSYDLNEACEDARFHVKALLEMRKALIIRRGNTVVECPQCGDPAEYQESVSPFGVAFRGDCDSCGWIQQDSA